jgi:hypothetical protein
LARSRAAMPLNSPILVGKYFLPPAFQSPKDYFLLADGGV